MLCACCLIVTEAPKHRNSLHIATEHVGWLSYVRFEVLTVVDVRDVCLLGFHAAYLRKEEVADILVLPDGCFKTVAAGSSDMPVPICQTEGITSRNTVLTLKFVTSYVMLIMFLIVRFVLSDFRPLLTFLSIKHRILNYGPTELLTNRGKDNKYFPSWAGR
jgi:hypothetical protein